MPYSPKDPPTDVIVDTEIVASGTMPENVKDDDEFDGEQDDILDAVPLDIEKDGVPVDMMDDAPVRPTGAPVGAKEDLARSKGGRLAFEDYITIEKDDGGKLCFKQQPRHHGFGAYPHHDVTSMEECEMVCVGAAACKAYEWDFGDEPWLEARCWIHWKPYSGVVFHPSVVHYGRVACRD